MSGKLWLGIVFTPSWLRVACVQWARSQSLVRHVYGVPLPVGCINEDSGAIEDSSTLQAALASLPCMNPKQLGLGSVFLVVPQLLCYRTAFTVSPALRYAPIDQLLAECVVDLPGDRSSLVVDVYAHDPSIGDPRSVMVVAARRIAIEAYTRLFAGYEWCLAGVTTGEIARFNRWKLQRPDVSASVVLICTSDVDSRELSVWDRGVLTASDTRYWRQRSRFRGHASMGTQSSIGDNRDMLTREILTVIEKQRSLGRPVESVLFGGTLRKQVDLQLAVSRASGVPHDVSVDRLYSGETGPIKNSLQLERASDEHNGLYDDALGATAPTISRVLVRQRRRANGLYQSYA